MVREEYGRIARQGSSCCGPSSCCGKGQADALVAAIGYGAGDLASLPESANMGLSCGNPTAVAMLEPGEWVADLGSGGGLDVFVAARKVGPSGRVIGVDMTPEMIAAARANAATFRESTGLDNVEFRLGEIEHLPLVDSSVDVVISNCVINLSPDKPRVWKEIARVLKPGGRVAVSDLALLKPLPDPILRSMEALVGCIAGAVLVDRTRAMIESAGLVDLRLETKHDYIEAMSTWQDPLYKRAERSLPPGARLSDYITSLNISAMKP